MKKSTPKKPEFSPATLRHAADAQERLAGRMLSSAAECADFPGERDEFMKKARKAQRAALSFRRSADLADLD